MWPGGAGVVWGQEQQSNMSAAAWLGFLLSALQSHTNCSCCLSKHMQLNTLLSPTHSAAGDDSLAEASKQHAASGCQMLCHQSF